MSPNTGGVGIVNIVSTSPQHKVKYPMSKMSIINQVEKAMQEEQKVLKLL